MIQDILNEKYGEYLIGLDIYETKTSLILSRIIINPEMRNSGIGTNIMEDLINYADNNKKIIALTPSSDFGGNKNKLIQFYKRFGFKHNKGIYKSFEYRDTMIRYPKLNESMKSLIKNILKENTDKTITCDLYVCHKCGHDNSKDTIKESNKPKIKSLLRERLFNEVRYIDRKNIDKEQPLSDTESIRVFHGFYSFDDVETTLKRGLSGQERANRIYSYETRNNPDGLFVSISFDIAKKFASSGVIIEFTTKVLDLEAPIWVGGRSYFVQGEYAESFKDLDEREQQKLINRQIAGENPYDYISKSDRPELAETIFDNPEHQALYIGNLNPNMIKNVWYNEKLHKERLINGEWVKYNRKFFINQLNIDTKRGDYGKKYLPNDNFSLQDFSNASSALSFFKRASEGQLKDMGFFPKQIAQIMKLKTDGYFDKP
jgi:hypothetical protein